MLTVVSRARMFNFRSIVSHSTWRTNIDFYSFFCDIANYWSKVLRCSSQLFSIFPSFEPSCWPMWVIFLITTDHHQNSQTYKNHRLVFCWKSWQHCAVGGGGAYSDAVLPPKRRLHLFAVNLVKVKVIKYSFLHLLLDLSRRCKALPGTTYVGQTVRIEHNRNMYIVTKFEQELY